VPGNRLVPRRTGRTDVRKARAIHGGGGGGGTI